MNGNTNTCTQSVTVADDEPPTITCPANIVTNANFAQCSITNVDLGTPVTADNCGVATVTSNAPVIFLVGSTNVVWTVTDIHGNSATCTQSVTVVDDELPAITCPANVSTNADLGQCFASGVALGSPVTADNCGIAAVTNDAPAQFAVGPTIVTWTVTDVHGNTNSCQQTVSVADNQSPSITCPSDVTVNADRRPVFRVRRRARLTRDRRQLRRRHRHQQRAGHLPGRHEHRHLDGHRRRRQLQHLRPDRRHRGQSTAHHHLPAQRQRCRRRRSVLRQWRRARLAGDRRQLRRRHCRQRRARPISRSAPTPSPGRSPTFTATAVPASRPSRSPTTSRRQSPVRPTSLSTPMPASVSRPASRSARRSLPTTAASPLSATTRPRNSRSARTLSLGRSPT